MIVSAVKSPYELSARIEDFLNKFDFENINEETFEKMKNGLK